MRFAINTRWGIFRIIRRSQRLLFACAEGALSYCAFVLTDPWLFQRTQGKHLLVEVAVAGDVPVAEGVGSRATLAFPRTGTRSFVRCATFVRMI